MLFENQRNQVRASFVLALISVLLPLVVRAEPVLFKIGASIPLSGDLAYVGIEIQKGLELGAESFSNQQFKFQVIVEDDQFLRKNALTAGKKLIEVDKVNAVVSLWDMAEVIAPLAERAAVPHFAIRWNPHVAEQYSYTLTVESTYKSYVKSLVDLLIHQKVKTIALLHEEAEGWNLGVERLKDLLAQTDIKMVFEERYVRGDVAHQTIILKALKKAPDIVLIFANPPNVELFIKKIRERDPTQRFTGYFEILDHPELAEGMPFVAQLEPEPWFIEKYSARFHTPIKSRAPQSYDIVAMIADTLKNKESSTSGAEIVKILSNIRDFPGASGILNAKGVRTIEMNCVWKTVKAGKFTLFD